MGRNVEGELMRNFYIPNGKYLGDYPVYEGVEDFRKVHPDKPIRQWNRDEDPFSIEGGDWIEALDGYIVPCLYAKLSKTGLTKFCRFPMGTFSITNTKNGIRWAKFYAFVAQRDPYSIGGSMPEARASQYNPKLIAYGNLLASGVNYLEAYRQVDWSDDRGVENRNLPKETYYAKILYALSHPIVVGILKDKNADILKKMEDDEAFSDENMINMIKDFMANVRSGSMVHLNSLVPLLKLTNKI